MIRKLHWFCGVNISSWTFSCRQGDSRSKQSPLISAETFCVSNTNCDESFYCFFLSFILAATSLFASSNSLIKILNSFHLYFLRATFVQKCKRNEKCCHVIVFRTDELVRIFSQQPLHISDFLTTEQKQLHVCQDLHQQTQDNKNFMLRILRPRHQPAGLQRRSCCLLDWRRSIRWGARAGASCGFLPHSHVNLSSRIRLMMLGAAVMFWGVWKRTFDANEQNWGRMSTSDWRDSRQKHWKTLKTLKNTEGVKVSLLQRHKHSTSAEVWFHFCSLKGSWSSRVTVLMLWRRFRRNFRQRLTGLQNRTCRELTECAGSTGSSGSSAALHSRTCCVMSLVFINSVSLKTGAELFKIILSDSNWTQIQPILSSEEFQLFFADELSVFWFLSVIRLVEGHRQERSTSSPLFSSPLLSLSFMKIDFVLPPCEEAAASHWPHSVCMKVRLHFHLELFLFSQRD